MFGNAGIIKSEVKESPQSEKAQPDSNEKALSSGSPESKVGQEEMEEVQRVVNEYISRIKARLDAQGLRITELIYDKVVLGEYEGAEYEVVQMEDMMKIIQDTTGDEFSEEELKDIEAVFAQLGSPECVFVESLLELFGELPPEGTGSLPKSSERNLGNTEGAPVSEPPKSDAPLPENDENGVMNESNTESKKKKRSIKDLDEVSVEIMMLLTRYIHENEIKLYELFNEAIIKKTIKTKNKQQEIDIMNSADFFSILRMIDCLPYEKKEQDAEEHKNMSDFLCIDRNNYPTLLSVKRLQHAIQFFATDPTMRNNAEEYFNKLAESKKNSQPLKTDQNVESQPEEVYEENQPQPSDKEEVPEEMPFEQAKPKVEEIPEQKDTEPKKSEIQEEKQVDEIIEEQSPKEEPIKKDSQKEEFEIKEEVPKEEPEHKEFKQEKISQEHGSELEAGQLAALQKEERKEHHDVTKKQLGEKYNYDEEFNLESEPESKTPLQTEEKKNEESAKKPEKVDSPREDLMEGDALMAVASSPDQPKENLKTEEILDKKPDVMPAETEEIAKKSFHKNEISGVNEVMVKQQNNIQVEAYDSKPKQNNNQDEYEADFGTEQDKPLSEKPQQKAEGIF